jgi:uncharacterized pyridoxamine 5'-phosphate oxidase family protein
MPNILSIEYCDPQSIKISEININLITTSPAVKINGNILLWIEIKAMVKIANEIFVKKPIVEVIPEIKNITNINL